MNQYYYGKKATRYRGAECITPIVKHLYERRNGGGGLGVE